LLKKVLLIENLIDCQVVLRHRLLFADDFVIVSDNADAQAVLSERCVAFKTKADFFTAAELKKIKKSSIQYMDSWYLYNDFLKYKGLQVGSLYSLDYSFIERVILYIEKITKIVEMEQPRTIIVNESLRSLTERILCACHRQDIECEVYHMSFFQTMKNRLLNNPYYQYLTRSFKPRFLLNQMRDYVLPIPREFKMKGKGHLRTGSNSVLVTVASRNEVRASANTIRELQKRGYNTVIFLVDNDGGTVLECLEKEGFGAYVRPGDLFNGYYKSLYRRSRMMFEESWSNITNDSGFEESLLYKEIPILRYVSTEKLKWMATKLSSYWAVIYEMVSDFTRNASIKSVVAMNDSVTLGRIAATVANEAGIPSIDIQHGTYISIPAKAVATKWCIWGTFEKNLLMEEGIPGSKLAVCGNSYYDSLDWKKFDAGDIRRIMGVSERYKTIITWAPSAEWFFCYSGENYNERMFQGLQEVAEKNRNMLFMFKPHPSERVKKFKKMLRKSLRNMRIVDPEQSIDEIIYISDIVMSWNSSVIIEAVILDKPVIGMNFFGQSEKVRCASEGIAIEARSIGELENAIRDIISDSGDTAGSMKRARVAYMEKFLYKTDSLAASRIVDELEDLMKNPPSEVASALLRRTKKGSENMPWQ
jgi:hypothetical protein